MKKRHIVWLFLLFSIQSLAQNAYYDALTLSSYVKDGEFKNDANSRTEITSILLNYLEYESLDPASILHEYNDLNPFIKVLINDQKIDLGGASGEKDISRDDYSSIKSLTNSIGGLDVTNIADGLAKFMVERTKQELNAYFFDEFKVQLENSVELQTLFPQTAMHLSAIGKEIYNYNAYIQGLRESFEFDLSNLFVQAPKLIDTPKYKAALDKFPELRYILKTSFYIINELDKNVHPGDILHQFPDQFQSDNAPANLKNGIHVVDLFSQSLRSKSKESYWISAEELKLLNDKTVFRIYLGLIYQKMPDNIIFEYSVENVKKTLNFKTELKSLGEKSNDYEKNILQYQKYIQNLGLEISKTETALKNLNNSTNKKNPDPKDLYAYIQSCLNLVNYSIKISDLPYIKELVQNDSEIFQSIMQYTSIANHAANLYLNVSERNYGTAIISLTQIVEALLNDEVVNLIVSEKYNDKLVSLNELYEPKSSKHASEKGILEKEKETQKAELKNTSQMLLKYGSFMASIVQAENSEDVQTIIESTAMPAGSFRVKRESNMNVSVNGFLGFFGGYEFIENAENNFPNNFALSAPIGISITKGACSKLVLNKKNKDKGLAHGLFVSIIDIGALASFRFADDSSEVASKVELKHILAPGIFYSLHFRNSPLTLTLGGQMGPLLREVTASDFKTEDNFYYRVGFSLVVDIPLFNLYNRIE
jgi:hypothetical protein